MAEEDALVENVKEYLKQAKLSERDFAYNAATTLYFKAIAVLIDYILFKKEGKIPSNHTERFRILQSKYPELYKILDKDFPFYQNSYRLKLNKEYTELLKDDFRKVAKIANIEFNN